MPQAIEQTVCSMQVVTWSMCAALYPPCLRPVLCNLWAVSDLTARKLSFAHGWEVGEKCMTIPACKMICKLNSSTSIYIYYSIYIAKLII